MHKDDLLNAIEKKRLELFNIVAVNGLTSPFAVKCSQELDLLLNDYDRQYIRPLPPSSSKKNTQLKMSRVR
ncbi:aspartyl-phosphate phosphatase Spo0E family protein [Bacillus sp. B190/17]|uniref:Aspartyl-phosphate phosphatase Spo0E family protein n=1 Tax=Bacillus lumedeiriae TaxID=3058829 RepID=A0ABW8I7X5_9BACI